MSRRAARQPESAFRGSASPASRRSCGSRPNGDEQLYHATLECYVDLNPLPGGCPHVALRGDRQRGGRRGRDRRSAMAESLAAHIAERVRERQGGLRAEVTIKARYPEYKQTPVSGLTTQELYTLIGTAVASEHGVRRLVGVEAQGMTACPCAQELVAGASRERLVEQGFTDDEIERVFEAVPVATHNQRGIGSLYIGCPEGCDAEVRAETLLRIVEDSMSSEIFELMKRSDERAVVEKAHRRPRFVEDCVREMLRGLIETLPGARRPRLRARPPGEPRDDPPAQRRGRALRAAGGDPRGARLRPPLAAPPDDARVAGESVAAGLEPSRRARSMWPPHVRTSSRRRIPRSPRRRRTRARRRPPAPSNAITAKIAATCRIVLALPSHERESRRPARPPRCAAS